MSNKILLFATATGISIATSAWAVPLSPLHSQNSAVEARTVCDASGRCWTEAYPGRVMRPGSSPLFEGRSVYMHKGYLYDPMSRRHYDRTRGRWVNDVGSIPGE